MEKKWVDVEKMEGEGHGKVKFGSLMGALKTGAHQLKVVNFDPNYLNNVCFF